MRVKDFAAFIIKREEHRLFKLGKPLRRFKPDPIITEYRFCNVRREHDRVTMFVREWSKRYSEYRWFAYIVARLFNNPATLDAIGHLIVPFKPDAMRRILREMRLNEERVFNPAYIVSTNGRAMDKVDYVIDLVLLPIWEQRKKLDKRIREVRTLSDIHALLQAQQGLGSFMAAQVVADLKYDAPWYHTSMDIPTNHAPDWYTFAASGPGSRRGLNRVLGRDTNAPWTEPKWAAAVEQLHSAVVPLLPMEIGAKLHRQDVQNCLCEFDKYERARTGAGRPKQKYTPHEEH